MRILYDGQIYSMQKAGGVNRYFASIISRLPSDYHPVLSINERQILNYPSHHHLKVYQASPSFLRFRPHRVSNWLTAAYQHEISASRRYDVIHPTYYGLTTQQELGQFQRPVVLTVYDMIHELFSETVDPNGGAIAEKKRAIMAAQVIICISHNTKRDLLERYDIPEESVYVTHLASDMDASTSHGAEAVPERPYFLYVGSRWAYKNFDGLVSAFRQVLSDCPDTALCVVGPPFTEVENRLLTEQKVAHRIEHYGQVGDSHLAKLYRCSVGFVYPSLYEGFGIPPLEAMACGTVAIAANASSLPEVIGDAGILFDPRSDTDLAEAMLLLLSSPSQRDRYIKMGKLRSQKFNWDKTTEQTVKVYQAVTK
jgi:glycosyltransferase involved in cell wall biosynthesis